MIKKTLITLALCLTLLTTINAGSLETSNGRFQMGGVNLWHNITGTIRIYNLSAVVEDGNYVYIICPNLVVEVDAKEYAEMIKESAKRNTRIK